MDDLCKTKLRKPRYDRASKRSPKGVPGTQRVKYLVSLFRLRKKGQKTGQKGGAARARWVEIDHGILYFMSIHKQMPANFQNMPARTAQKTQTALSWTQLAQLAQMAHIWRQMVQTAQLFYRNPMCGKNSTKHRKSGHKRHESGHKRHKHHKQVVICVVGTKKRHQHRTP